MQVLWRSKTVGATKESPKHAVTQQHARKDSRHNTPRVVCCPLSLIWAT